MSYEKTKISVNQSDIDNFVQVLNKYPENVEEKINEYLHNTTARKIISKATSFLPVSKRGTRHAKNNTWYKQYNYNLAVKISNNTDGKNTTKKEYKNAKKSYYYLYFPATGKGTSKNKGANPFHEKTAQSMKNNEINELIKILSKETDKSFK